MKKTISTFAFFLLLLQSLFASTPDEVANAIKTGDATEIAKHFNDHVDLKILNKEDVYSRSQAELILKDFFSKHPIKTFKIIHKSAPKGDSQYSIGLLETYNGQYRVYFLIKKTVFKVLVCQFRIESENE